MLAPMADAKTWAKRVAAWRASGLSREKFAAGGGFTPASLKWWAWRLGHESPSLVRVVRKAPRPSAQPAAPIVVEVRGARVVVPVGFDRASLCDVLELLRAGDVQK